MLKKEKYQINGLKKIKIFEVKKENESINVFIENSGEKALNKLKNKYRNQNISIKYIYSTDSLEEAKKIAVDFYELK